TIIDIGKKLFQAGPVKISTRKPTVVIALARGNPALGALADDIGLASLSLGVEAVEFHVEPFLARLAGVDGAAQAAVRATVQLHHASSRLRSRRPKQRYPFQRVPVISRATAERDLNLRPCQSKPSFSTVTV